MNHYKINLDDTFEIVNDVKVFDLQKCLAFIKERGKDVFSPQFIINAYHKQIYFQLLIYAIEDEQQLEALKLNPKKGLLLMGDSGTGKTAMMHLTKPFYANRKKYVIKNCNTLANEFSYKGYEAIMPLLSQNAAVLCLDNMGKETSAKHFGNTCDTTYTIVEHFYEQRFNLSYPKLHVTTSLSPAEIQKRYGVGFRKMLQELCNVIVCD